MREVHLVAEVKSFIGRFQHNLRNFENFFNTLLHSRVDLHYSLVPFRYAIQPSKSFNGW